MVDNDLRKSFLQTLEGAKKNNSNPEPKATETENEANNLIENANSLITKNQQSDATNQKPSMRPVYLNDDEYSKLSDIALEMGFSRKKRGEDIQVGNISALLRYLAKNL